MQNQIILSGYAVWNCQRPYFIPSLICKYTFYICCTFDLSKPCRFGLIGNHNRFWTAAGLDLSRRQ